MVAAQPANAQALNGGSKKTSNLKRSLRHAITIQEVIFDRITSGGCKPIELASCARAWCDLEERKRILRGKPLPGALKPVAPLPKHKPDAVVMGD